MKLKQFLLFKISEFYPSGGLSDVIESFEDLESAVEYVEEKSIYVGVYIWDRINDVTHDFE